MNEVELSVIGLSASISAAGNFVLVLQERDGERKLSIIIGLAEAQAIALSLEKIQPLRPLAHDVMIAAIRSLKASLECVKISAVIDGVYHALLVLKDADKNLVEIDTRTSDAVALAIREQCPLLIHEGLLAHEALKEGSDNGTPSASNNGFEQNTLQELHAMLSHALQLEDYEKATLIHNIITAKQKE